MLYGYARVSTDKQDLNTQKKELMDRGVLEINIYCDVISGKEFVRENLDLLLTKIKKEDEVLITRYDRLGRELSETSKLIKEIEKKGCCVNSICEPTQKNKTPFDKLNVNMTLAIAEFERDLISDRTKRALQLKRFNGIELGRPKKLDNEKMDKFAEMLFEDLPMEVICAGLGISESTYYRAKRKVKKLRKDNVLSVDQYA